MQHILNSGTVPPGGVWKYRDEETSFIISHPYLDQVRARAHKHRLINNLPIPSNWEEMFEDNVCRSTGTAPCAENETAVQHAVTLLRRFSGAMKTWAKSGFKLVDDETLAARRLTCEGDATHPRCPQWHASTRFFGFGRCGKCGCATGLKTALATEKCPLGKWEK